MLLLLNWDEPNGTWFDSPANSVDGFADLCAEFEQGGCNYFLDPLYTAVDPGASVDPFGGRPIRDWHEVRNMDSFTAEADERSKRLTFTHDADVTSDEYRRNQFARFTISRANRPCRSFLLKGPRSRSFLATCFAAPSISHSRSSSPVISGRR